MIPPAERGIFSLRLILHGRRVLCSGPCRPRLPRLRPQRLRLPCGGRSLTDSSHGPGRSSRLASIISGDSKTTREFDGEAWHLAGLTVAALVARRRRRRLGGGAQCKQVPRRHRRRPRGRLGSPVKAPVPEVAAPAAGYCDGRPRRPGRQGQGRRVRERDPRPRAGGFQGRQHADPEPGRREVRDRQGRRLHQVQGRIDFGRRTHGRSGHRREQGRDGGDSRPAGRRYAPAA